MSKSRFDSNSNTIHVSPSANEFDVVGIDRKRHKVWGSVDVDGDWPVDEGLYDIVLKVPDSNITICGDGFALYPSEGGVTTFRWRGYGDKTVDDVRAWARLHGASFIET